MRKTLLFAASAATFLLAACNKEMVEPVFPDDTGSLIERQSFTAVRENNPREAGKHKAVDPHFFRALFCRVLIPDWSEQHFVDFFKTVAAEGRCSYPEDIFCVNFTQNIPHGFRSAVMALIDQNQTVIFQTGMKFPFFTQ